MLIIHMDSNFITEYSSEKLGDSRCINRPYTLSLIVVLEINHRQTSIALVVCVMFND